MSIFEAIMESRATSSPPIRVSTAMQFVAMMRSTAVRPAAYDGGPVTEIPQAKFETATYTAAMECLRVYFNGEHFLADQLSPQQPGDETPPAPEMAPIQPAPRPLVPAGQ